MNKNFYAEVHPSFVNGGLPSPTRIGPDRGRRDLGLGPRFKFKAAFKFNHGMKLSLSRLVKVLWKCAILFVANCSSGPPTGPFGSSRP